MRASAAGDLLLAAGPGRLFRSERRVRLADVLPSGESRLDALARYLQDVASDDMTDVGLDDEVAWIVRRTRLHITSRPVFGATIELRTWCSGIGPCWAERRTTIAFDGRSLVEAASLWVALDSTTQRPVKLNEAFVSRFAEASGGRRISSRLVHPEPAPELLSSGRPWPLRVADVDFLGHVNNAVGWAAIEDELTALDGLGAKVSDELGGLRAEIEYRASILREDEVKLVSRSEGGLVHIWLVVDGAVRASAVLGPG